MKILTRNECARYLLSRDNFCILSHRRPDGDTIGSSAALCLGLRSLGKKAYVLFNCEVSDRFAWLLGDLTKEAVEEGDTVVSVDVASPGMLPKAFEGRRTVLRFDGVSSCYYAFVNGQYAGFGKLIDGFDVLDKIATTRTGSIGFYMQDVPRETIEIETITRVED